MYTVEGSPLPNLTNIHPNTVGAMLVRPHGRMNYKDTKPYMSAFLSVDLLTDFAAFCSTDFIDWRYTHSWFVFLTQLVNCYPPWMGRNYTCVLLSVAPLLYHLSDLLPSPPFPMYSIYCQGSGVLRAAQTFPPPWIKHGSTK